jgi:hypothetical protein
VLINVFLVRAMTILGVISISDAELRKDRQMDILQLVSIPCGTFWVTKVAVDKAADRGLCQRCRNAKRAARCRKHCYDWAPVALHTAGERLCPVRRDARSLTSEMIASTAKLIWNYTAFLPGQKSRSHIYTRDWADAGDVKLNLTIPPQLTMSPLSPDIRQY